jgi:UDP-glucuronate 4-epimerase
LGYSKNSEKTILVTGAAGFIGSLLSIKLLNEGFRVIGVDNLNDYYCINLKKARLDLISQEFSSKNKWLFYKVNIEDKLFLEKIFEKEEIDYVVNLAAQAGVRNSLKKPMDYINSNLVGFINILELCRYFDVKHLVYASSSSVYGGNTKVPFNEDDAVNHPISLYAATKKSNELMAHSYSHLFGIPSTGLRFFTVYGPWGRPDMAPMIFADLILKGKPISIFNYGNMKRDFTYIDDIVEAIFKCIFKPASKDKFFKTSDPKASTSFAPHRVFNIGNNEPIDLVEFINIMEKALGKKAIKKFLPLEKGDVKVTCADTTKLEEWINFRPKINISEGIHKFVQWYRDFYNF